MQINAECLLKLVENICDSEDNVQTWLGPAQWNNRFIFSSYISSSSEFNNREKNIRIYNINNTENITLGEISLLHIYNQQKQPLKMAVQK